MGKRSRSADSFSSFFSSSSSDEDAKQQKKKEKKAKKDKKKEKKAKKEKKSKSSSGHKSSSDAVASISTDSGITAAVSTSAAVAPLMQRPQAPIISAAERRAQLQHREEEIAAFEAQQRQAELDALDSVIVLGEEADHNGGSSIADPSHPSSRSVVGVDLQLEDRDEEELPSSATVPPSVEEESKAKKDDTEAGWFAEDKDDDDDEEDDAFFAAQLFAHAKRTAEEFQRIHQTTASTSSLLVELQRQPQDVVSTALVVVDASEEAQNTMKKSAARKVPPPPPAEQKKLRQLRYENHESITYPPFEKDFYIPPAAMKAMSEEEIQQLLKDLDGARMRGADLPRPMRTWDGTGLPEKLIRVLQENRCEVPFAVQCLGIPCLMSGRDMLIQAKTGSGKTLTFVLPMIRHAMHQPRCRTGEGPIGLILCPTQELAVQTFHVASKYCAAVGLRVAGAHGGMQLSDNIAVAKAGCDLMVATPGRLVDLLTLSNGNLITLRRTTFVAVDEADRLFDSGFTEHVVAFLKKVRPDRQLVFLSATMPKPLKKIVLSHLYEHVELSVGGRATPASNVKQDFCFFDEQVYSTDLDEAKVVDERFRQLLVLLGNLRTEEQLALIFVQVKEECDQLFAKLSSHGYGGKIAVLHSGMDKLDREFALERFHSGDQYLLIATGVAERGLDVLHLDLVVNYSMPDHFEAYVHRIGRTGRAGKPGRAVSFFTRVRDDEIAGDLAEGLERAGQEVPEELNERAMAMREKRKEGLIHNNTSYNRGYRHAKKQSFGKRDHREQMAAAAKAAGLTEFLSSDEGSDSAVDTDSSSDGGGEFQTRSRRPQPDIVEEVETTTAAAGGGKPSTALTIHKAQSNALSLAVNTADMQARAQDALRFAQKMTDVHNNAPDAAKKTFTTDYPINDLPTFVRTKLQSATTLKSIAEETNTTIVRKGFFCDPRLKHSHKLKEGDKPLSLHVIGHRIEDVRAVIQKLDHVQKEARATEMKKWSSSSVQL